MLQRIKIDNGKESITGVLRDEKRILKDEMERDIQQAFEQYENRIQKLEMQLKDQKLKTKIMGDLIHHQELITGDLTRRMDNVELALAKKSAILTGLNFSDDKKQLITQLHEFFIEALNASATIEDAYTMGEKTPKPVVIQFATQEGKSNIFRNKSALKNIFGENQRKVYLNDYLPGGISDKKRRERDIIKTNNQAGDSKVEMEKVKGGLKIGQEMYKKKVSVPTPSDLLDLNSGEMESILDLPTTKGPSVISKDSKLIAYGLDVTNYQQIRQGYKKIKILHAKARHIVCAYFLDGKQPYFERDYQDDGEQGAGRMLLENMIKSRIHSKCFYIVRYCGEDKLGSLRFTTYLKAVQELLREHPYNHIVKEEQRLHLIPSENQKDLQIQQASPPHPLFQSGPSTKQPQKSPNHWSSAVKQQPPPQRDTSVPQRGGFKGASRGRGAEKVKWTANNDKQMFPVFNVNGKNM